MDIFLVGGAVRDGLLNLPVKERDWVVIGSSPEELREQGFRPVGKDFPVFLHPTTKEEHALARTERKTAPGYGGFHFHTAPDVTLEEDLLRRDLTINAIAQREDGSLIDPYGGQEDLANRVLRHVSSAFSEDPVRVLRAARFYARFAELGFTIHPETLKLMADMVSNGEIDALTPERVWQETRRTLEGSQPRLYFEALRDCGALKHILPELDRLFGIPQPETHHPEIDCGIHTLMVLDQAVALSEDAVVRFAALTHDLGKGLTDTKTLPQHIGHESRGIKSIESIARRLKIPKEYKELAVLCAKYHTHGHRALELRPTTILKTLEGLDAFRRPARFQQFLLVCEADARGRTGFEDRDYPQKRRLQGAFDAARAVDAGNLVSEGLTGQALGAKLRALRLDAISQSSTLSI